MVRLDRITTRGGDRGETSLGDGTRLAKDAARIEAIGAVDEANAALGVLRLHTSGTADATLARAQNDLFDLGADLAVPGEMGERLRLTDAPTEGLEADSAALNANLPPLKSFVLPGGSVAAAHAHVARTVVRRAERRVVTLAGLEPLNPAIVRYLNRLSDYLFILARHLNADGAGDVLWTPGANR